MNNNPTIWLVAVFVAIVGCPLIPGIINKTKAFFAGRHGAPVLQLYYDLAKLLKKGAIVSTTSCGLVRMAPVIGVVGTIAALLLLPLGCANSPLSFVGDAVLFLYLLGTVRFTTVLGALDTGSAFEGMGASREVQFAILAEITAFAILIFLALLTNTFTLNGMLNSADAMIWIGSGASMLLALIAFFMILLCENCRVPFDDPETHLELTMIHEAMILDNAGPDLALIHYGAALKLWLFGAFMTIMITPVGLVAGWWAFAVNTVLILLAAVGIGIVESVMGRCRFFKTPKILVCAFSMALSAILLQLILR